MFTRAQFQRFKRSALRLLAEMYAPYMVYNMVTGGTHFTWSKKQALEWMECYHPADMGETTVFNYFDKPVASTLATSSGTALVRWH